MAQAPPDDAARGGGWYRAALAAGDRLRRGLFPADPVAKANAHRPFQDPSPELVFLVELALAMGLLLVLLVFPA